MGIKKENTTVTLNLKTKELNRLMHKREVLFDVVKEHFNKVTDKLFKDDLPPLPDYKSSKLESQSENISESATDINEEEDLC